jgi:hypothetical protein
VHDVLVCAFVESTCGLDESVRVYVCTCVCVCVCARVCVFVRVHVSNINGSLIPGFLLSITFFRTQMACFYINVYHIHTYLYTYTMRLRKEEKEEVVIRLAPVGGGFLSLPTPLSGGSSPPRACLPSAYLSSSHKMGFHLELYVRARVCEETKKKKKKYVLQKSAGGEAIKPEAMCLYVYTRVSVCARVCTHTTYEKKIISGSRGRPARWNADWPPLLPKVLSLAPAPVAPTPCASREDGRRGHVGTRSDRLPKSY